MQTAAVIIEEPRRITLRHVDVADPAPDAVVVDITHHGISGGTERLLWQGRMPTFPGMGYPLVPGYEAVGEIVDPGCGSSWRTGDRVFVPGSTCFSDVRPLFGAAARRLIVPACRLVANDAADERGILLALAATAHHALAAQGAQAPELIVGHGTLGRLVARVGLARGDAPPMVWETDPARRDADGSYPVCHPDEDERRDYRCIVDCSGDASLLDTLIGRLAKGGEIVLAGFYEGDIGFSFAPAFMREARFRIAAEWTAQDMTAVRDLLQRGRLSLDGLITHRAPATDAARAYARAFDDASCRKMILDWRHE